MYESYAEVLESYMIEPAMETEAMISNLPELIKKSLGSLVTSDKVKVYNGKFTATYEKDPIDTVCVSIDKTKISSPAEYQKITKEVWEVLLSFCKKTHSVLLSKGNTYALGKPNVFYNSAYGLNKTISFFGKQWDCAVEYKHGKPYEGEKALNAAINKFPKISKDIEEEFCKICERYLNEWTTREIKKYSDIKNLTLDRLVVFMDDNKVRIKLCGDYYVDEEHGWSISIVDGKWTGGIMEYMSYE